MDEPFIIMVLSKIQIIYSMGRQIGKSLSWHPNGYPNDSIYLNEDRSGVHVSWFNNGIPSAAGRYSKFRHETKWQMEILS